MKSKISVIVFILAIGAVFLLFSACKNDGVTKLLYQGHASIRLTAKNGAVIYVDPAYGEGYDLPADIILVTHYHGDHNKIDLVTQKKGCVVITNYEALKDGSYKTFNIKGIKIETVEAKNFNHDPKISVGFIITIDGIQLYHAGDTDKTTQMETFSARNFDYALLPCDGEFNMNVEKATECAELIGAKHSVPIHTGPFNRRGIPELFNREIAERFTVSNRFIIEPGEEIEL